MQVPSTGATKRKLTVYSSGCSLGEKAAIRQAYKDANKLVNQDGVKSNIDWDSLVAQDFLGPSIFNPAQRQQIQAVFANMATVSDGSFLNPFKWSIRVRCKEPEGFNRCTAPPWDPCRPRPARPWEGHLIAYSWNQPGGYNNPEIMFCPMYFTKPSLGDVMSGTPSTNLHDYLNTAETFLHELMHCWLGSDSKMDSPNPRPDDLMVTVERRVNGGLTWPSFPAYGPALTKLLARYAPTTGSDLPTGFYVQRNGM